MTDYLIQRPISEIYLQTHSQSDDPRVRWTEAMNYPYLTVGIKIPDNEFVVGMRYDKVNKVFFMVTDHTHSISEYRQKGFEIPLSQSEMNVIDLDADEFVTHKELFAAEMMPNLLGLDTNGEDIALKIILAEGITSRIIEGEEREKLAIPVPDLQKHYTVIPVVANPASHQFQNFATTEVIKTNDRVEIPRPYYDQGSFDNCAQKPGYKVRNQIPYRTIEDKAGEYRDIYFDPTIRYDSDSLSGYRCFYAPAEKPLSTALRVNNSQRR